MNFTEITAAFIRHAHRQNDADLFQMCGLAEGTNANTLKTQTAIVYQIANVQYSKAATDNIAMTACSQQVESTFCYYLVSINVAGTITVTKGTNDAYALPSTPAGQIPIGAFKIVTAAGYTFTSGTTDLSATGITATFYDIDTGMAVTLLNQGMRRIERGVTININGYPVTVSNWEHMKVKYQQSLVQGDDDFTCPITNYKELFDARVTDANSFTWPSMKKNDYPHAGVSTTQGRPIEIGRIPKVETSLTPDVSPTIDFWVWPQCDASYTLNLIAYQYSPYLDGVVYTSNWWTENAPEILIHAGLVELCNYARDRESIQFWKDELNSDLVALYNAQKNEKWAGSLLNIKAPDPFSNVHGNIYSFTEVYDD